MHQRLPANLSQTNDPSLPCTVVTVRRGCGINSNNPELPQQQGHSADERAAEPSRDWLIRGSGEHSCYRTDHVHRVKLIKKKTQHISDFVKKNTQRRVLRGLCDQYKKLWKKSGLTEFICFPKPFNILQ